MITLKQDRYFTFSQFSICCYLLFFLKAIYFQLIEELSDGHAAVRVGAATTNLEMLNWSNKSGWTLPLGNIYLFCITLFLTLIFLFLTHFLDSICFFLSFYVFPFFYHSLAASNLHAIPIFCYLILFWGFHSLYLSMFALSYIFLSVWNDKLYFQT